MVILKFRMLSDENDHFIREYEITADTTLSTLHNFILESLEYEPCIASFYTADSRWERLAEFTSEDMDFGEECTIPTFPMNNVQISSIITHIKDRLIYHFDIFGNRAYYLELAEVTQSEEGKRYPRVSFAHATAPDQYDPRENIEDGSIFDVMMGDFGDFDDEGDYSDEF